MGDPGRDRLVVLSDLPGHLCPLSPADLFGHRVRDSVFGRHVVVVVPNVAVVVVLPARLAAVILWFMCLGDLRYRRVLQRSLSRPPPRFLHLHRVDWFFAWYLNIQLQIKLQSTVGAK